MFSRLASRLRSGLSPSLRRPLIAWVALQLLFIAIWRIDYVQFPSDEESIRFPAILLAGILWRDYLLILVFSGVMLALAFWRPTARTLWALKYFALLSGVVAFAAVWGLRLADHSYHYYSGLHLDETFFDHAQGSGLGIDMSWRTLAAVGTTFVYIIASLGLLFRVASRLHMDGISLSEFLRRGRVWKLAPLCAIFLFSFYRPVREFKKFSYQHFAERNRGVAIYPEARALRALVFKRDENEATAPSTLHLDPIVQKKLERFGLRYQEKQKFPFLKPRIFSRPFERAKAWAKNPNVLFIFLESFSLELTNLDPKNPYPGLTPNLVDFAKHSMSVRRFFNSATPTFNALKSSFCSLLVTTDSETWFKNKSEFTHYNCLPRILEGRGYSSTYILQVERAYLRMGDALQNFGFGKVHTSETIRGQLHEEPKSWGFSDHQIFRFLVDRLQIGEFAQPFLVGTENIDSHPPFTFCRDCITYGDGKSLLLNTVHSADHAFGIFWEYFKKSPYFDNTIVFVMTDHAMFPGKEHAEARRHDIQGVWFDEVPLLIYSPYHDLPKEMAVTSSHLDLAPTLLHMLDINVTNHFDGHSLFEKNPNGGTLGMHNALFFINEPVNGVLSRENFTLEESATACKNPRFDAANPRLSRCEFLHYFQWLHSMYEEDRIWPD